VGRVERISPPKVEELLDLKERFGITDDPRRLQNADLCVNIDFGRGYSEPSPSIMKKPDGPMRPPEPVKAPVVSDQEIERVVQEITDRIMGVLG